MSTPISILGEVLDERLRQHEKWGEQNHTNGTGPNEQPLAEIWWHTPEADPLEDVAATELAKAATKATDDNASHGDVTYADILLEEVFEALAESDPGRLRTELIQVAAVATQWVEAIDRRAS